jgi:hypothetical protein
MTVVEPSDLVRHVSVSSGLTSAVAARLVADVLAYFDEPVEVFVRRRHHELQHRSLKNAEIWPIVTAELAERRFVGPEFSERQLRRIVYG